MMEVVLTEVEVAEALTEAVVEEVEVLVEI